MATKARHRKTATQLWVYDNRKRLGLEPADLARLTGVTEATARGWESRGRPSEEALATLERRFGVVAPDDGGQPSDQSAVIAVLARLADAMEAQTRVLEAQKGELAGYADGVQGLLARLVSEHVGNGAERAPQRAARR